MTDWQSHSPAALAADGGWTEFQVHAERAPTLDWLTVSAVSEPTAVVGAGDFIGASPLFSGLLFDEPAVETLNKIGVDLSSAGNHEFGKGKDELRLRANMSRCISPRETREN